MPLPEFLEPAVRQVAFAIALENWPARRKCLIDLGFRDDIVDHHEHEITLYTKEFVQKTTPRTIPKQGNPPPSPESESSPPRYTTDHQAANLSKNPTTIMILLQGLDGSVKSDPIGCEYSEDEENKICFTALEGRRLQSQVRDNMIRLVWHKPQEGGRTHPTIFHVVSGEEDEQMRADIRFGRNWLKGAPLEIDNPTLGGKRKRSRGEIDEAERARGLTRQRQPPMFGPGMGDPGNPDWAGIGTAMGQALLTFCNGGVQAPRYSGHTEGIEEEDSESQGRFHYNGQNTMQPPPD